MSKGMIELKAYFCTHCSTLNAAKFRSDKPWVNGSTCIHCGGWNESDDIVPVVKGTWLQTADDIAFINGDSGPVLPAGAIAEFLQCVDKGNGLPGVLVNLHFPDDSGHRPLEFEPDIFEALKD